MTTANIYLNFNGNCFDAFTFYKSVFGGEYTYISRFKDMPPREGCEPITGEMGERIMHVSLPLSSGSILMGSDTGGEWAPKFVQGNNFSISVSVDSKEEADRLFSGLSQNGQVLMPMENTFWGEYFGTFDDKFGINWMVSCRTETK